jgi:GDP-L-fucose synthase
VNPPLINKVDAKMARDKKVVVRSTANVSWEFLYIKDAAEGILLAAEKCDKWNSVNLGVGKEIRKRDLVYLWTKLTLH